MDEKTKQEIRAAFRSGSLTVKTSSPQTGEVSYQPIQSVLKHHTPHKAAVLTTLEDGRSVVTTEDHSLFLWFGGSNPIQAVEASSLSPGSMVAVVEGMELKGVRVSSVVFLPPEPETFDLSVPGPENFVLSNGILAHNSYSVGGISLDLERSSKYSDAKQNAMDNFNQMLEKAKATVKVIRGLQQPKYGIGIRSAFGPTGGTGQLTPAKFMGAF
jgi:hypothetical protein